MRAQVVVEPEERVELGVCVDQRNIILEVDLVVFGRTPEAFDEDVVDGPAAAIHRDADRPVLEDDEPLGARELAALVGVEDLGIAVLGERPGATVLHP